MAEIHSITLWGTPEQKFCPKCKTYKDFDCFYRVNANKSNEIKDRKTGKMRDKRTHASWCIECRLKKSRASQKLLRESGEQVLLNKKWYANVRKRILKTRYGMTVEEYDALAELQNNLCAICGNPETTKHKKGTAKRLCVDHDHSSGKLRQLLCHNCNCGLGRFFDDPERLEKAVEYLRRHK